MANVVWTEAALAQLEEITSYIAQFNEAAAERIRRRIDRSAWLIGVTPGMGRRISRGRRQVASVRPYLLRYRVEGDVVRIVEIRHSARRPNI